MQANKIKTNTQEAARTRNSRRKQKLINQIQKLKILCRRQKE